MQRSPTWARNSKKKMIFILSKLEAAIPQRWLLLCFTKIFFIFLYSQVEAVVKSLIKIRSEDSEAKSLVFSTWTGKFGDKLGLCFVNILPDKSFFVVYDFYILTQMCWIFWGRLWMKTTFLTLRFTTGLKPNISRQLSFPELCVESFILLASQPIENKISREIWVFQNFVFESCILSSGATTQGNFKRNLQKFKNREDVKVLSNDDVIIKGRQKS